MGKELWDRLAPEIPGLSVGPVRNEKWGRWHLFYDEEWKPGRPGICITQSGHPDQFYFIAFKALTPERRAEWLELIELDSKGDHPTLSHQDVEDFKQVLRDLEEQNTI
jgi:hypothetical protein